MHTLVLGSSCRQVLVCISKGSHLRRGQLLRLGHLCVGAFSALTQRTSWRGMPLCRLSATVVPSGGALRYLMAWSQRRTCSTTSTTAQVAALTWTARWDSCSASTSRRVAWYDFGPPWKPSTKLRNVVCVNDVCFRHVLATCLDDVCGSFTSSSRQH